MKDSLEKQPSTGKKKILLLLKLIVTVGVLASVLQAHRWRLIVGVPEISFRKFLHFIYLGYFYRAFLPGSMTADLEKIYLFSKKYNQKLLDSSLLIFSQVLGILFQWILGSIGLLLYWKNFDLPHLLQMFSLDVKSLGIMAAGGVIVLFLVKTGAKKINFAQNFESVKGSLKNVKLMIQISWLTFALQICTFTLTYFHFRTVGLEVPFMMLVAGMALMNTLLTLPISLGGIGVMEFLSFIIFADILGFSKEMLVSTAIIGYGFFILYALLGGVWILFRKLKEGTTLGNLP